MKVEPEDMTPDDVIQMYKDAAERNQEMAHKLTAEMEGFKKAVSMMTSILADKLRSAR